MIELSLMIGLFGPPGTIECAIAAANLSNPKLEGTYARLRAPAIIAEHPDIGAIFAEALAIGASSPDMHERQESVRAMISLLPNKRLASELLHRMAVEDSFLVIEELHAALPKLDCQYKKLICDQLHRDNANCKYSAAKWLRVFRVEKEAAIPHLLKEFQSLQHEFTKLKILSTILEYDPGFTGGDEAAKTAIKSQLKDGLSNHALTYAEGFSQAGPRSAEAVLPALKLALVSDDSGLLHRGLVSASNLDKKAAPLLPAIVSLMRGTDREISMLAAATVMVADNSNAEARRMIVGDIEGLWSLTVHKQTRPLITKVIDILGTDAIPLLTILKSELALATGRDMVDDRIWLQGLEAKLKRVEK